MVLKNELARRYEHHTRGVSATVCFLLYVDRNSSGERSGDDVPAAGGSRLADHSRVTRR
jgi:hypothetical protein